MIRAIALLAGLLLAFLAAPARAWHHEGHQATARGAVAILPATMPAFFRAGSDAIAHCSVDPDKLRNAAIPELTRSESPEHFIDLELLQGKPLPKDRYDYLRLCNDLKIAPDKTGTVPYSIQEWTQRLTIALAEHRKWPDNQTIQSKCLVYAGILAHYAGDMCQPLHTTIHYDGRKTGEGKPAVRGIHSRVDDVIGRFTKADLALDDKASAAAAEPLADLFAGVVAELMASHALVDRVYELDAGFPAGDKSIPPSDAARQFSIERYRAASVLIARLYVTAWTNSAKVTLPAWLE